MKKKYDYIDVNETVYDYYGKNILIWGRGISALDSYIALKAKGANIMGFVDSFVDDKLQTYAGQTLYKADSLIQTPNLIIYIATHKHDYRMEILEELAKYNNPEILIGGWVLGPSIYDLNETVPCIDENTFCIDYVRRKLSDEISLAVFDNMLEYRRTNDYEFLKRIPLDSDEQYYNKGIIKLNNDEIFIDGGGYNGSTSRSFARHTNNRYNRIIITEPDEIMYDVLCEYIRIWGLHDVNLIKKGLWNTNTIVQFDNDFYSGSSHVTNCGGNLIDVVTVDMLLNGDKVTFIKMDIEGAEREALEGSKDTICEHRPKLAISIYHKYDDLWVIPYRLMNEYPEYNFYIRQYGRGTNETVLYAV